MDEIDLRTLRSCNHRLLHTLADMKSELTTIIKFKNNAVRLMDSLCEQASLCIEEMEKIIKKYE